MRSLYEITRELLQNRPVTLTLKKIASDLDISVSWLGDFLAGQHGKHGPGVNTVQRLYEYLSQKPLLNSDGSPNVFR